LVNANVETIHICGSDIEGDSKSRDQKSLQSIDENHMEETYDEDSED
jgi:hypothetical protein